MNFTFKATPAGNGFSVTIKRAGELLATIHWNGTKSEALHQARIAAECYGFIDGAKA